jgi:hypothetical protein
MYDHLIAGMEQRAFINEHEIMAVYSIKEKLLRQKPMLCEISSSHGGEYDVKSCLRVILPCRMIVDNHSTWQYNPEDSSEQTYVI